MARNHFGRFRRAEDRRPMDGEFRQGVPAARPSAVFALIVATMEAMKGGEITEAEGQARIARAKAEQRAAIMAGRF